MKWSVDSVGICDLVLDDLPCNEIGSSALEAFEQFFSDVDVESLSGLIIRSTLESGFCAGANLRELSAEMLKRDKADQILGIENFIQRIHSVFNRIDALPCPTLGVINGICFGGGFELALTCDILIAEESARFCFPELRLGLIPGFGGIPRLKREIGNAAVRDLLFTGRSFNASKALSLGLVSQVVPNGRGTEIGRRMLAQTAKFDREVFQHAKKFTKEIPLEEMEQEKKLFLQLIQNPRVQTALDKFVNDSSAQPYLP